METIIIKKLILRNARISISNAFTFILLAIGAIFAGFLFKDLFIGHSGGNSFWGDSIKFLNPLSTEHPPLWFLLTTPALVLTSIPIAYYLFVKDKEFPNQIAQSNKPLHNFLINKWYFDELYEFFVH